MLATARLLGQTVGATLVAALFRLFPNSHGAALPLGIACGFGLVATVISTFRLATPRPPQAGGDPGAEIAPL